MNPYQIAPQPPVYTDPNGRPTISPNPAPIGPPAEVPVGQVDPTTVPAPNPAQDRYAAMMPGYLQQMRQSRLAQILAQRAAAAGGGVVSRPSVAGLTEAPAGLNNAAGRGAQQNGANIGPMPPMEQVKPGEPMSGSASFSPRQQAVAAALSPRPYRTQVDLGWVGTPGTAAPTGQTQSPQGTRPQQGGTGPGGRLF